MPDEQEKFSVFFIKNAATAALAIGDYINEIATEYFKLR